MSTLDIYVPQKNFEKHLNLGITYDHINILYKEFLDRILTDLLPSDSVGATEFYTVKSNFGIFTGIDAINTLERNINIYMPGTKKEVIEEYNGKYIKYANSRAKKFNMRSICLKKYIMLQLI